MPRQLGRRRWKWMDLEKKQLSHSFPLSVPGTFGPHSCSPECAASAYALSSPPSNHVPAPSEAWTWRPIDTALRRLPIPSRKKNQTEDIESLLAKPL